MSHLNQISHFLPPYNLMYPYSRASYYPYYIPDHIQELNQQSRAYKIEVLKWLKSLDTYELYRIFQIKGQIKTFPILQMYIYDRLYVPSNYASKQQCQIDLEKRFDDQFIMKSKQNHHVKSEEFYDLLQITDEEKFMDSISLKVGTLSNMNQFLEILQAVSYQNFLSQIPQVTQDKVHDPEWFTQQCFHSCEEWIVKEFEKNIALNYAASHDRKKKIKAQNQTTIKNNNNELNNFFTKYLANNKDKLTYYFEQITRQMHEEPTNLEHRFYSNIFQGSAIKILKPQKEILASFLNKCHSESNILQSMQLTKMNELLDQKTYYLKKFYPIILRLYQEHLEEELINYENLQKLKSKKDKKRKKSKSNKLKVEQYIDQTRLNSLQINETQTSERAQLTPEITQGENQNESTFTPFITQDALLIVQEIQSLVQNDEICGFSEEQFDNLFEIYEQPKINEQEEMILTTQAELASIIQNALDNLIDEECFLSLNFQAELPENKKCNKSSLKSLQKDEAQLISPQSEMAIDIHCRTTQSYVSNRTESFTEEENKNSTFFQDEEINHYSDENNAKMLPHQEKEKDVEEQHQVVQQKLQTYQDSIELKSQKCYQGESESLIQSCSTQCSVNILQNCFKFEEKPQNNIQKGRDKMFEIISINIIDFTDSILKDYDDMLPYRILTYERIKVVIQNVFFGMPDNMIKLFGSCATGLALIDSDIDIGINGFEQYSKNQLREPFQQLQYAFTQRKWVIKSNPIFNSIVPVIKLEIDPAVSFNEFDDFLNLTQEQHKKLKELRSRLKSGIKVDVSFSCYGNHLGYATTELVMQWMKEYPSIQQLVLLCKTIIKKLGLSENYKGGLSSYSLIVMIYSYIKENRIKSESLGELFVDMMYFYSTEFDPSEIGIGLSSLDNFIGPNEPSYFFKLKDYCLPKLPITIFSPLNKRLLTGSCSHINKLLQFFGTIYETSQQSCKFFETYVTFGKKKQQKLSKEIDDFILKILQLIH